MSDDLSARVASDLKKYRSLMSSNDSLTRLEFDENSKISRTRSTDDLSVDWVYTIQNMIVAKMFYHFISNNPEIRIEEIYSRLDKKTWCIDIGSQIDFISVLASMANYVIIDPSIQPPGKVITAEPGLIFMSQEAQALDFPDGTFLWATSLHAIEHFGLGRYGDTIDPMGDIRGIREIHRVLQKQGLFAGSVPIVPEGQESVVFNKNRNYSIPLIKEMLETAGFRIEVEQVGLSPTDGILRDGAAAHTCTPTDYKELKLDEWATIPDSVYVWLARKI